MKHEAFVYMWTDFSQRYIGYHKGDEEDGYICSASEEFYSAYYSDRKWKRRVLARGTVRDMLELEHKILNQVDAKNNPRYYNKSNGGIYKKGPNMKTDFVKVQELKESIDSREYELRDTVEIFNLPRYQTRSLSVYAGKVNEIADRIKEAGSIDKMSPIIIVTNTLKGDQLLDGNHTIHAAKKAKLPSVKVIAIDFTEFNSNELNLIALGNALNHVDIIKTPPSNEDIKQTLMQAMDLGEDITDRAYKKSLADATGRPMKAITRMVTTVIDKPSVGVFRVWEKEDLDEEQAKTERANPDAVVVKTASGSGMTERGLGSVILQMSLRGKSRGIIIFHHSKPKYAESFNKKEVYDAIKLTGLDIQIKELDNVPI